MLNPHQDEDDGLVSGRLQCSDETRTWAVILDRMDAMLCGKCAPLMRANQRKRAHGEGQRRSMSYRVCNWQEA